MASQPGKVYLIIGRSSSTCGACGGNASPQESQHIRGGPSSGWSKGSSLGDNNGCRVKFDAMVSEYVLTPAQLAWMRQQFSCNGLPLEAIQWPSQSE